MKILIALACLLPLPAMAAARPVVVELFTSEACSSCPPAEAVLAALKQDNPAVLPLAFHVTYWNGPAWTDAFSLTGATARQNWYAGLWHTSEIYTPQAVVDGQTQMIGSDQDAVAAAIAQAAAAQATVPVSISGAGTLTVKIGPGAGPATVLLVGYDNTHTRQIGGGENGGATLTEVNTVRSITNLGRWSGTATTYQAKPPAGMRTAVLVQRDDGKIDGAATD